MNIKHEYGRLSDSFQVLDGLKNLKTGQTIRVHTKFFVEDLIYRAFPKDWKTRFTVWRDESFEVVTRN